MINKRICNVTILNLLFSITAFCGFAPYFIWHENIIIYYAFVVITFSFYLILLFTHTLTIQYKNLNLFLFTIFIITYMNFSDLETFARSIIINISLFSYILMTMENKKKIYTYLSYIIAISLLPSIIVYVCHQFNIELNWSYLKPMNPLKTASQCYYKQYFGAVILTSPHSPQIQGLYRLCGMFDEPGVVGTLSALLLIGDRLQIKKNFRNIVILIGGILSFSLAFYILILVYLGMLSLLDKNYKNVIIIMIFVILIGLFNTGVIENDFINNRLIQRMQLQDGRLQGDNRTSRYYESQFEVFLESGFSNIIFGMGKGASIANPYMAGSSSWKNVVYDNGFVGFSLLILFLVIITLTFNRTKYGIMFLLIMLASIYQRPGVLNLSYMSVFLGGLANLKTNPNNEFNSSI